MNDVELMEKIKSIQGLLWRPFVDELLIRSKKWFEDRDKAADRIEQLERQLAVAIGTVAESGRKRGEAEAKLAKALQALRDIAEFSEAGVGRYIQGVDAIALDALAELEAKE